ncbi:hypothetical protein DICPUDRAFT_82255 [Dictyostelium purpureum]|uniref:Glutaredoxin-like protein n=1 Tax=Dictyostelium purpureum TaxID=5786 RepID=F0ZVZ7_DICPU|nr:uncharacterized protein DICPUDRAFT_82255 [Dictyostelium purpureum]EGC31886.1 hypothetical protein DICPUDRAFT_82255 [Dictyostelium purpureum]|eukprot:XP_003291587.1 hypothetical protein DICPUDRAFT_82255 [Dictyostelium purpureum]
MLSKIIKSPIVIRFFSRPSCSLCQDAKEIVYPAVENFPEGAFKINEIDIDLDSNKEYYDRFKNDVPVGMIEKKVIFKHRIDEDKLYFDLETMLRDQIKKEKE